MVVSNYIFNENQERPIYFSQTVGLIVNGKVLYSQKHDGRYASIKTKSGTLKYLDNFILEIGVYKANNQNYFAVEGWGGCNSCSLYYLLIDQTGKVVYKLFWIEKTETIYSKFGSIEKVFKNENDRSRYLQRKYFYKEPICHKCLQSTKKNLFNDPYNPQSD
ncbi:hypothetical protein [Xanthocytophaga agilis]|nr:hypothetical protein [Xanthocytophaga agilis]